MMKKKFVMNEVTKKVVVKEAYEDFIKSRIVRNLSERSIAYYKEHLSYFFDFALFKYVTDYTRNTIDDYIVNMKEHGLKDTTINIRLRAIKVWFKWIEEVYDINMPTIKLIKEDKVIKQCYSLEEIEKLLREPNKAKFDKYRDWVMVQFLLCTGARLSSVVNVHIEDINFESRTILFRHSKNRSQYIVPLAKQLDSVLREYISVLPSEIIYLFPSQWGTQLSAIGCQQAIRRYCKERGVDNGGIHRFRHTFATNYARATHDVFRLQQLLNHSDITVSRRYVHMSSSDLAEGFDEVCIMNKVNL